MGISEAEMYCRHANEIISKLFETPDDEAMLSAADSLIHKSRRIMVRLIDEDIHHRRGAAPVPASPEPEKSAPRAECGGLVDLKLDEARCTLANLYTLLQRLSPDDDQRFRSAEAVWWFAEKCAHDVYIVLDEISKELGFLQGGRFDPDVMARERSAA